MKFCLKTFETFSLL